MAALPTKRNTAAPMALAILPYAAMLAAAAIPAWAQTTLPADPVKAYSSIGLIPGETLRVNVVNLGGTQGFPPGPCMVEMGFVNLAGASFKTMNETIPPGQSAFLTLTFQEASALATSADTRARVNVRPVLSTIPPGPCRSISSAEVYDSILSRDSAFAVPFETPGSEPPPDPDFGIVGITALDSLRLNVTNITGSNGSPPDPCNVQIGFVNAAGASVRTVAGTIEPGHTAFVAINYLDALGGSPSAAAVARIDLRPTVAVPPDPCRVAASAELVDLLTGQTRIYLLPAVQGSPAPAISTNGQ